MKTQPDDFIDTTLSPVSGTVFNKGLTKREYFSAMAMQGILSMAKIWPDNGYNKLARSSVKIADALIDALNEPELPNT